MVTRSLPAIALAFAALAVGGIGLRFAGWRTPQEHSAVDPDQLFQITPHRIPMKQALQTLCIAPPTHDSPHELSAEILVYANGIAVEYRRQYPHEFNYPIGSKFVKEKFSRP